MNTPFRDRKVLIASGGALLLAVALLLTIVLPAEYGWDPLGSGAALGVLGLAHESDASLVSQNKTWRNDRIVFQLAPMEALEYKYRLAAGATMLFEWRADDKVLFDMHGQPDGAAPGYARSFAKARGTYGSGSYSAAFPGLHGWYWQNRGQRDVTVTLETSGFFSEAVEMRDGREFRYELKSREQESAKPHRSEEETLR